MLKKPSFNADIMGVSFATFRQFVSLYPESKIIIYQHGADQSIASEKCAYTSQYRVTTCLAFIVLLYY